MIGASLLLVSGGVAVVVLLAWSPGTPEPFLDSAGERVEGSVSEKRYVDIDGVKQGMFIKSLDVENPVLLYLHGGMPDYFLTQDYPTGLERLFTVAWWEQPGSGLSYHRDLPPERLGPERHHAYLAVAQMSNQLASEKLAHGHMLRRFRDSGEARRVRQLENAPVGDTVPLPEAYTREAVTAS